MNQEQPTLEDRIEDKERVRVNLSKDSYLTILFALESAAQDKIGVLTVAGPDAAKKLLEKLNDLAVSIAEYTVNSTKYKSK